IEKGRLSASSELAGMAGDKGCTPVQLALAWLLSQEQVITIPESKNRSHLEENLGALEVELSAEEKGELDRLAS
ncbi:MAG: aldo/keto reductase, partial [Anaerolineae bacterium]|nr:aldo/keto reductase [Anaerolineae bacterium]